jgi:hypothetical protein
VEISLPNTSPANRRSGYTHVKILTAVESGAWNGAGFVGRLYPPGARISAAELPGGAIALEYAGPQGTWQQRNREREGLWILWRYDLEAQDWREIARAVSRDWHWAVVLRGPAIRALELAAADPIAADPTVRAQDVAYELLVAIDSALSPELPAVRKAVLSAVYDSMAGRLAAA